MAGGFRRGELIFAGGRPSMGKSTLGVSLLRSVARAGHGVLMFSMEMPRRDCIRRMATDACWTRDRAISYIAVKANKLTDMSAKPTSAARSRCASCHSSSTSNPDCRPPTLHRGPATLPNSSKGKASASVW
jgi:replicative DNA helicase